MKRHIHFISQFKGSLNEITEDLIEGLKGHFVVTREGEEEPKEYDILLTHFIIPKLTQHNSFNRFKHKVLIQPIDGTVIKRDIVKDINKYDIIITPAQVGKDILINNGVKKPIIVIPNFYKKDFFFHLTDNPLIKLERQIKNRLVFYHESTCHPRKGVEEMLTAYVKEFSSNDKKPNVVFILKSPAHTITTFEYLEGIKKRIIKLQKQYKYPAEIIRIAQWLEQDVLKKLWGRCDCYIHCAKIEGFGIPLLRMTALQKPILTLDNPLCGYMEFINRDKTVLVPTMIKISENEINPMYTETNYWREAEVSDLQVGYREIYNRLLKRKENTGDDVIFRLNSKYMYERVIKQYIEVLKSEKLKKEYGFIESDIIIK